MRQQIEDFVERFLAQFEEPSLQRFGPIVAAFPGSLALMLGADFGARDVLPTLLPERQLLPAALLLWLGTFWVCLNAVANSTGRAVSLPPSPGIDELPDPRGALALLSGLLALPGLPGAFLLASGTAALFGNGFFGALFGLLVGGSSLAAIVVAVWSAGDPDPALPRAIKPLSETTPTEV